MLFIVIIQLMLMSSCCTDDSGGSLALALLFGGNALPAEKIDETNLQLHPDFNWRKTEENITTTFPKQQEFISSMGSEDEIKLRDAKTGTVRWTVRNFLQSPSSQSFSHRSYNSYASDQSVLFHSKENYFCLDKASGVVKWKKQVPSSERMSSEILTGVDNWYFQTGTVLNNQDVKQDAIFIGHLQSPAAMTLLSAPDFQTTILDGLVGIGNISDLKAFHGNNDNVLLAISSWGYSDSSEVEARLSLWDVTNKRYLYQNILLENVKHNARLEKVDNRLYAYSSSGISCYNLYDETLLWSRAEEGTTIDVEFSKENVLIDFNNNGKTDLLDNETGEVLWTYSHYVRKMKMTSRHVYLVSNVVEILDIQNGLVLKTIDNPYSNYPEDKPESEYFKSGVSINVLESEDGEEDYMMLTCNGYLFGMTF